MSKEQEDYKKDPTASILLEIDKDRLIRSSGDAYARSVLSESKGGGGGGGGGGCFPGDVNVLTPRGLKKIASLKKGDLILSYSSKCSGPGLSARRVTKLLSHAAQSIETVHFSEGQPLRTTRNHTLLTTRGWLRIDKLKKGDTVIKSDGSTRRVEERSSNHLEPVYNLHTAGEHNFVVEGCVVHNFSRFRLLRTLFHWLFIDVSSQVEGPCVDEAGCPERRGAAFSA